MDDRYAAFVRELVIPGAPDGPLTGLTFAVKDNLDVAGIPTGAGSPAWLASHGSADETAPVIRQLLAAGATLAGKTHMDEMAFGMLGENEHHGTPINPRTPDRVPGGSSSGSAVAVAAGLTDFALGTDTGGSVRVPASNQGLYGFRPTHGRVPTSGLVPFAPIFDTVGWFASDATLLRRVGEVLLEEAVPDQAPSRLLVAEDVFDVCDPDVCRVLEATIPSIGTQMQSRDDFVLCPGGLRPWVTTYLHLQFNAIRASLGDWIRETNPTFGRDTGRSFELVWSVTDEQVSQAQSVLGEILSRLDEVFGEDDVVCIPTVPQIAPLKNAPADVIRRYTVRTLSLTCIASLGGLPQITLPLAESQDAPVGLSLIGRRGADLELLALGERIARSF